MLFHFHFYFFSVFFFLFFLIEETSVVVVPDDDEGARVVVERTKTSSRVPTEDDNYTGSNRVSASTYTNDHGVNNYLSRAHGRASVIVRLNIGPIGSTSRPYAGRLIDPNLKAD